MTRDDDSPDLQKSPRVPSSEVQANEASLHGTVIEESSSVEAYFSGPIPPPAFVKELEIILPGAAERLFSMAEKQQQHRLEQESKLVAAEIEDRQADRIERRIGQFCGLTIGIVALAVACITTIYGYPIVGTLLGVGGVAGLVGVFVYERRSGVSEQGKDMEPEPAATLEKT